MSNDEASKKLGEYLLKGWTMTDETCPNEGCYVPLMRSEKKSLPTVTFCVRCDGVPNKPPTSNGAAPVRQPSPNQSQSSHSECTHTSRTSTPLTEPSSELSLTAQVDQIIPTPEARRRREQSDQASAEIGSRLLRGWAMLAEECPNVNCFGIPLVRPPSGGRGKVLQKECVVCGTVYVEESYAVGHGARSSDPIQQTQMPSRPASQNSLSGMSMANMYTTSATKPVNPIVQEPLALQSAESCLEAALRALSHKITILSSQANNLDIVALKDNLDAMEAVLRTIDHVRCLRGT